MNNLPRVALAAALVLASSGFAGAMPLAPSRAPGSLVRNVDATITKTVRTGPLGGRIVTKRVVRRGPLGGRSVTVTKTVR